MFRQFKIINTIAIIRPLILELRRTALRIILYGSCARGEDIADSDIDLYILANDKRTIRRKIEKVDLGKGFETIQIQPVIVSPTEAIESEKSDVDFLSLVREGIVLWEKTPDEPAVSRMSQEGQNY